MYVLNDLHYKSTTFTRLYKIYFEFTPGGPTNKQGNPVDSANANILNTSSLLIKEVSIVLVSCALRFVIDFVLAIVLVLELSENICCVGVCRCVNISHF